MKKSLAQLAFNTFIHGGNSKTQILRTTYPNSLLIYYTYTVTIFIYNIFFGNRWVGPIVSNWSWYLDYCPRVVVVDMMGHLSSLAWTDCMGLSHLPNVINRWVSQVVPKMPALHRRFYKFFRNVQFGEVERFPSLVKKGNIFGKISDTEENIN